MKKYGTQEQPFRRGATPFFSASLRGIAQAGCSLIAFWLFEVSAQPSLLVCVPGNSNTQQVQTSLESTFGASKVLVFGRIKDLETMIVSYPDASLVAPSDFVESMPGFKKQLQGKIGNATGESFLIIAASPTATKENLTTLRVGIVDFLGRERLSGFVKTYFGLDIKNLKRANKLDDLLTMLGMETVDAIIIGENQLKVLKGNTKLTLTTIKESSQPVNYVVFAAKNGASATEVKMGLLKQPATLLKEFGIEKWEGQ
jgi:hypothetical protein